MRSLLIILLLTAGCGASSGTREPDEYNGCATDEHWRTFDDQERANLVMISDAMAPIFTAPAAGRNIPFSMKPIFSWNQDPIDPGMPAGSCFIGSSLPCKNGWRPRFSNHSMIRAWDSFKGKQVTLKIYRMTLLTNDVKQGPYAPSMPFDGTARPSWWGGFETTFLDSMNQCLTNFMRGRALGATDEVSRGLFVYL